MRTVIAIAGRPGTGKSTLMRKFISEYASDWKKVSPAKLVEALYSESTDTYIVGKYEDGETFPGTDKLSMGCPPEVTKWLQSTSANVIFEGDRLTGGKFYDALTELKNTKLHIIVISVKEETLTERYKERGSDQNEVFLRGRATKISNVLSNFDLSEYISEFSNESLDDQKVILNYIKGALI